MQLAAEEGKTKGLNLICEGQGNNATEARWHCAPGAGESGDSTAHRRELKRTNEVRQESGL